MEPSALPTWAQALFYVITAAGVAITGLRGYVKKKAKEEIAETGQVPGTISASFIDSKLLKELIEAMRELQDEQGRDSKKSHRMSQDLRETINDLNESIIAQTDATLNLVRFVNRRNNREKLSDENE